MSLRDRHIRVSDVLSLILNPSAMTGVFLCVLAAKYEPGGGMLLLAHDAIAVLFASVLPIGAIFFLISRGLLSDVEMSIREERDRVFLMCTGGYALGAILLIAAGAVWPVWGFVALHVPNTLLLIAANHFLKVSIHTMVLTGLYVGLLVFFGSGGALLGIVVVAAAWARWDAGNHTAGELAAGALLGALATVPELAALRAVFGT